MLEQYYNRHVTFHRPPFSIWLEDVYIGLLAEEFNTTVNDLTPNNVPYEQYSVESRESKEKEIIKKGFLNTLFIYEKTNQILIWTFLNNPIPNSHEIPYKNTTISDLKVLKST